MIAQTNKTRLLAYLLAVVGCFPLGTFRSEEKTPSKETTPAQQQTGVSEPAPATVWIYAGGCEAVLITEQRYRINGAPTENARILHPFNKALSNIGWLFSVDTFALTNETPDAPLSFPIAKAESCEYRISFEQPLLQGGGAGGLPA